MKKLFFIFLVLPLVLPAQQRVKNVCRTEKLRYDSAMEREYGELFPAYFVFDKESYVWADGNHMCDWNDFMFGDTVLEYNFFYHFQFPGARIAESDVYGPETDRRGRLVRDTTPYPGQCKLISEHVMDTIARKHLHHSLSTCTVMLYPFYFYGASDTTGYIHLDSSHVFLEVDYYVYTGSGRPGTRFTATHLIIVVDGCTGQVLGPAKATEYSGISGAKF